MLPKLLRKLLLQSCNSGLFLLFFKVSFACANLFGFSLNLLDFLGWFDLQNAQSNLLSLIRFDSLSGLLRMKVKLHGVWHILVESVALATISGHRLEALRLPQLHW